MVKNRIKNVTVDFWFVVKVLLFIFLILFMLFPISSVFYKSLFSNKVEGLTLYNFTRFFTKKYYFTALINSLRSAIVPTILSVVIGVPLAYAMTRYNVFLKKALHIGILMSLMSPPFIGAYSWIVLFGRSGVVTQFFANYGITLPTIYGEGGIWGVFTLKLFPYVYLYVSAAMSTIDSSLEEAAENLGSSKLRRFVTITIPVVTPSILAGAIMVFMTAISDFGTPQLIGEGYRVLAVLIYSEYMSEVGTSANMASTMSVIMVICVTLLLLIQKFYIDRRNYNMNMLRAPQVIELHGAKRFLVSLPIILLTSVALLPQVVVTYCSFLRWEFSTFVKEFSLESYKTIFNRLGTNIRNTYVFSTVAIVLIVVIGILLSYIIVRRKNKSSAVLDVLAMMPYVIPGSVLGISFITAFNKPPLILTGTATILILSFVVRKMPYTVRSGSAFLEQMDKSVEEASINLGVSPMKTFFKITARLMLPGVLSGAIISWITCINELSSSVMLYTGNTSTITVAIYSETIRGSYHTAAALATILTVTMVIALAIFMKATKGKGSVV